MADYTIMRCLYCGRELALLKRLTGNGEFCSDQHKQSYHDEYNRLALSRLLQAQTKTEEGRAKKTEASEGPAPAAAGLAVTGNAATAPDAVTADAPARRERGPALPVPIAHKPELVAKGTVDFLPEPMAMLEGPCPAMIAPSSPLSWIPEPVFPVFDQLQPQVIEIPEEEPPLAELLEFSMEPIMENSLAPVQTSEAGPFGTTPPTSPTRQSKVKSATYDLPMAGPLQVPGIQAIEPTKPALLLDDSQPFFPEVFQLLVPSPAEGSAELEHSAELHIPDLELSLGPAPSEADAPAETEAPAEVEEPNADTLQVLAKSTEPEGPDTGSDASLKRLQKGLARPKSTPEPRRTPLRRIEVPVPAGPVAEAGALDGRLATPRTPSPARVAAEAEGGVATLQLVETEEEAEVEAHAAEPAEATAPFVEQMLPISLRIVSPAKPKLISEFHPLVVPSDPQLTTTEILPLRPRMGAGKPPAAEPSNKSTAAKPASPVKVKPVKDAAVEPVAPVPQDKKEKPFDPREAVLAVKRSINVPENKSARKTEKPAAAAESTAPVPPSAPVTPPTPAKKPASAPAEAAKVTPAKEPVKDNPPVSSGITDKKTAEKKATDKSLTDKSPAEKAAPETKPDKAVPAPVAGAKTASPDITPPNIATPRSPAVERPAPSAAASAPTPVPAASAPTPAPIASPAPAERPMPSSFELHLGMPEKESPLSKLPLGAKIGIAAGLVLALAGGGYLVFSGPGKSKASSSVGGVALAPTLMVGEGGWITDWAGDTTGNHRGRKISVYRPSLNLTNYQIEFQGRIENNSIGWVFRASNASNFYAIKLTEMGTGYHLLKYAIVEGKEREIGQVPIRPVNGNTFPIRLEVRGDHFTTFIGGNPVDTWVDGQLKSGGVGFLTDRGDRADITKVGISLLPGSAN